MTYSAGILASLAIFIALVPEVTHAAVSMSTADAINLGSGLAQVKVNFTSNNGKIAGF